MKNDTWKATAVATLGDAWSIQIAVKTDGEIMIYVTAKGEFDSPKPTIIFGRIGFSILPNFLSLLEQY